MATLLRRLRRSQKSGGLKAAPAAPQVETSAYAAQMKFLAYEASLSFLKGAASGNADGSVREEVQMTVDHCVASMTTDSVVGAIIKSLECRKTVFELSNRLELANDPDLQTVMRTDEERIAIFLVFIFRFKPEEEAVLRLEGDSAQHFLDVVQGMLDKGFLMKHTRMAFRIIRKLSESCDMLPTSLFIARVHDRDEDPSFRGGFADIYRASYGDQRVALKHMRHFFRGSDLRRIRLKLYREALIWKDLHHPNILPFLGIDRDSFPLSFCMVSHWMDHGTVMNYLKTYGHANVDKFLYEIAQGLEYLHSHNVVHGDLRGSKILIKEDRSACLAGFGFSALSDGITTMSSNRGGSIRWMAPELLVPERFGLNFARTPATDVYAFGCVCVELYTGRPPFSVWSEATVLMKVLNGEFKRPERPSGTPAMSDLLWQHITQSLAESLTSRPSSTQLVENLAALISSPQTSPATSLLPGTRSAPPVPTPIIGPETVRTASNVLELALRALSSLSSHIRVAGTLGGVIDSLLEIAGRIEQTSVDAQGFIQLATRIKCLPPIVEQMAESNPDGGQAFVLGLQTELLLMTANLQTANQRGELDQFFNSADNTSPLEKHNMVLAQMIADSTDLMTECLVATMNLDAKDTAKMKFLAYKASLSFLKCAGNTDQSLREEIQMTVDHCVASMTTDSVVGAIIKSLECRKTVLELSNRLGLTNDPDFRTAMRADEERIEIFLVAIFSSIEQKTVLGLKGDSAQDFLDVVQEMLDRGFLMKQEHTRMAFRIIRKLSESCDLLPTSLFVVGVTGRGEYPTCGGGFADIFLALYDNRPVALKRMRHFVRGSNLTRIRLKFCREALLWKDLHHPNILPFLGIDRDSFGPSFFCMVSPWMKHGTVINYLETHGHANVDKLLYEIVQGLEYLHSHNIVHGDLRGTNILIQEDGSACLADFGLSSFSDATVAMSTTRAGSPCWMAPELLAPEHFGFNFARTPATDVYAFGCVCFELYTGRPPFSTLPEPAILMKVLNSERPDRPSGPPVMSDMLWQHVTEFLAQSPTTRPSTPLVVQNMVWPRPAPRPSTPSGRLVACENLLGSTFETNESLSSSADHTAQASGRGEASQLATESIPSFHEINDGEAGTGGEGIVESGRGGVSPSFSRPLVSGMQGRKVPVLSIVDFCCQYRLNWKICQLLCDEEFETVGGLFQVSEDTLKEAGFKAGHIGELKRALMEFIAQAQ